MSIDLPRTDTEEAALAEAERSTCPFVVLRDDEGRQRIVRLDGDGPLTIGRRAANDIALPWDRQVSRVHAELRPLAGEWTSWTTAFRRTGPTSTRCACWRAGASPTATTCASGERA